MKSAHVAEIVALTRACAISENLAVTILSDSQYGFVIVHDYEQLWKHRGFLTSNDSPIKNEDYVADLLK